MSKTATRRLPVSERALLARLNRALAKEDQMLRKCRADSRWYRDLGDYALVDVSRNTWLATHVDLEALGREMGVLQEFEHLVAD
ncbi:MAG TPA: hypothetical protein VGR35_12020 [Tepidisphaeraceae bacterium]|nr:hypothetical protein [Tepidisphaeraceae bacterium]